MTDTISRAEHDARVAGLLAANNAEVEKRRQIARVAEKWEAIAGNLGTTVMELRAHHLGYFLADIMAWQAETFGPNQTLEGIRDHMRREVKEIEDSPTDRTEPIDLINLGISYLRSLGLDAAEVVALWQQRMVALKGRSWPDWRTADPDKAIEHHREPEQVTAPSDESFITYTEAEIGAAFSSYLESAIRGLGRTPRWREKEWVVFRSGLRARKAARARR